MKKTKQSTLDFATGNVAALCKLFGGSNRLDRATSNGGKQSAATTPTSLAAGDGDQRDQQDAAADLAQPSIDSLPVPDLATSNGGKQSAATTPTSLAAGDGDQRGPKRSLQCMVMAAGLPDAPENLPLPSFCKATKQQDQYVPSVMQGVICSR